MTSIPVEVLREHWLTGVECDHAAKTDVATCYCSRWRSTPQPNIPAAVDEWVKHLLEQCPSHEPPPALTDRMPHDVAVKILRVRDLLVEKDYDEAYHVLYSIADPAYTSFTPWADLERASQPPSALRDALDAIASPSRPEDYGWWTQVARRALGIATARETAQPPLLARPLNEWHEDMGDVVWWKFPVDEPAWIGSPLASDWPGYHTHWTPHPAVPEAIRYSTSTKSAEGG